MPDQSLEIIYLNLSFYRGRTQAQKEDGIYLRSGNDWPQTGDQVTYFIFFTLILPTPAKKI